jgi:pyridoxine 4-dehydrogenase
MTKQTDFSARMGGSFTFPGTSMTVNRMGYGAMQLAGPGVFGPPRDMDAAVAVLREAVASGGNHIDTSDFYGPHVTNQIIQRALHPYPDGLTIVTKVGARRGADKSWLHALSQQELIDGVHDNLRNLGLERLDVVNLRVGGLAAPSDFSIEEPLTVLAELKRQGLIRHLGLSNVSPVQLAEAQKITEIVCVQNMYNVAHRNDDGFIADLAEQGIAYVPFFPLGGFTPLQSSELDAGVAPPPFAEHPADPRDIVAHPSSGESAGGNAGAFGEHSRQARCHRGRASAVSLRGAAGFAALSDDFLPFDFDRSSGAHEESQASCASIASAGSSAGPVAAAGSDVRIH